MKRPPNDRGQGRKPIGVTAMPQIAVRLAEDDIALLKEIGTGNTSKGIRLLCQLYRQKTGLKVTVPVTDA